MTNLAFSQNKKYDEIFNTFKENYNTGNFKNIYISFSTEMKTTLPIKKTKQFFNRLKLQNGNIKDSTFLKYENEITTKRSMKRASADVGWMFVAYNVRRMMNIVDKAAFKKFMQELAFFDNEILTTSKAIKAQIRYLFLTNTNSISLNQAA